MIRRCNFQDIPAVVEIMRRAHQRSIYAETATFDEAECKHLLTSSMQRHGHKNQGGTLLLVSVADDEVAGFIIGYLDNVYPGLKELMATDLLFIMDEDAPVHDARRMLQELVLWAEDNAKCVEIHLGVSGAIGDPERTGKLYERAGFERCGAMYRREVAA